MALNPQVYGVDQTIRELKLVEPEFYKTARIDLRKAAEPIAVNIRAWIPEQAPLSGMKHNGRTGRNKAGVKVTVKQSFSKRTAARETSLVLIISCPVWTEKEEVAGLEAGTHSSAFVKVPS